MTTTQGSSINLSHKPTPYLQAFLKDVQKQFRARGCRGVYETEMIDSIKYELRSRGSVKAWETRRRAKVLVAA